MAALASAGRHVVVVTCFSGNPDGDWEWLEEKWRAISRPRLRRMEDEQAIARIGARLVMLGLPDAALRGDRDGPLYRSPLELLSSRPDEALVASLADRLGGVLKPGDRVHVPLAMGNHPDHRAVADAFRRLPGPYDAVWYEDFPYPFRQPACLTARLEPACDIDAWLAAAVIYRSQAITLFGSAAELRRRLAKHSTRSGEGQGDRVWIPRASK